VQLLDECYSIESATSKRASKEALKTFRLTATQYICSFGKNKEKKKSIPKYGDYILLKS
jgi:hypothetical protein